VDAMFSQHVADADACALRSIAHSHRIASISRNVLELHFKCPRARHMAQIPVVEVGARTRQVHVVSNSVHDTLPLLRVERE